MVLVLLLMADEAGFDEFAEVGLREFAVDESGGEHGAADFLVDVLGEFGDGLVAGFFVADGGKSFLPAQMAGMLVWVKLISARSMRLKSFPGCSGR